MRKKVIGVFWVLGIALLAFIIYKIGPKQIWEHINRITLSKFLILFGMRLVYFVLRAINWSFIMNLYEKKDSPFSVDYRSHSRGRDQLYHSVRISRGGNRSGP